MNHLEKYKQYLTKKGNDNFEEFFLLPLEIQFDAPAAVNSRKKFFTKTQNDDLLVVGCVTRLVDPFAVDTVTRNVLELDITMEDAQGNLFIRDEAPLYAVASHIYAPELWHESFVIPARTSLTVAATVTRSPSKTGQPTQDIQGTLVFKCVRFNRTVV
jgi:hypothetical protein